MDDKTKLVKCYCEDCEKYFFVLADDYKDESPWCPYYFCDSVKMISIDTYRLGE